MSSSPTLTSRVRTVVYASLGTLCVGLAVAGVLLPLLPTTPFLLLASFFFLRSSPRMYRWLHSSRLFGPFLRDWEQHHGVRRSVKRLAVVVVLVTVTASFLSPGVTVPAKAVLIVAAAIGLTVVFRLRTIPDEASQPAETVAKTAAGNHDQAA
jgi:uncharacterized protein